MSACSPGARRRSSCRPCSRSTASPWKTSSLLRCRSGTDLPLVLSGKIDAEVSVYNNELVAWRIEHPELKLRHWTMSSLGFDTPGYAIITSEELFKQKPQLAAAFTQGDRERHRIRGQQSRRGGADPDQGGARAQGRNRNGEMGGDDPGDARPGHREGRTGRARPAKWETFNELLKTYGVINAKVNLDDLLR